MKSVIKNDLFDYKDRYIYQIKEGFKFSVDSLLLAEYVKKDKSIKKVLDLCSGNAAIPLVLSKYTKALISGFEIQPDIWQLADMSIKENKLDKQIEIINDDVKNISQYYQKNEFDIITCNPPYFPYNSNKELNKNNYLTIARHEVKIKLVDIFQISSDYLKDNGILYLVHRPERLDEIVILADKYNLRVKEIVLITTKKGHTPTLVLCQCRKNSKMGIKLKNIDISELKTYQKIFEEHV